MTDNQIPLRDFVKKLNDKNIKCTLLGVGPVSEIVTRATIQACRNYDCPAIFIASRNQVDLAELGHGYLMGGMDQHCFVQLIRKMAEDENYTGPIYICRDHGGPWQRNIELDEKYPVEKAMDIGKQSFAGDIDAGFNYLHIDPTKCPHDKSLADIINWTVELLEFCEQKREEKGLGEIDYEVGTEDIQGGLTTKDTFEQFLKDLTAILKQKNLPLPTCVVAQTGTLTKLDRNVGHFDKTGTEELVAISAKYGVGLKEHNGDYLSAATCRVHPDVGVTGMNVAPEYGLVETDACLELADLEEKLVREGWLKREDASNIRDLFVELTWTQSPWQKWMTKEIKQMPTSQVEKDTALRTLIARVCGHYVYDTDQIRTGRRKLYKNLDRFEMTEKAAQKFVEDKVRQSIEFYLKHFRLNGVNSRI